MPIGIGLLRGINVGGKNLLAMERLRSLCEGLGLEDARTYIQSGNVVFRAGKKELARAAEGLAEAIERKHGIRAGVAVRGLEEMRAVIAGNPFAGRRGVEGAKLLVMFLTREPEGAAKRAVAAIKSDPEEVVLIGREVYLSMPLGAGKANLSMAAVERAVQVPGTCRNWNTVKKLVEMGEEMEGLS